MGRFISEETRQHLRLLAWAGSLGLSMVLATVMGLGAGYLVDRYFDTAPWGFFIGLLMGIVAGFRNIVVIMKRTKKM